VILVMGGTASGKRTYVRTLGYAEDDFACSPESGAVVVCDVQNLVHDAGADPVRVAQLIAAEVQVAIFTDIGAGIIPLVPEERAWRDRAGLLGRELAQRADTVVRMTCGIPQAIKGTLPQA
jgi:adenosyl cobinamide kinase/adenosyl cobinamide phosphate guanylyltransferase